MNDAPTGGAAFPRAGFYPDTSTVQNEDMHAVLDTVTRPVAGMSLRDYFAAAALTGYLAAHAEERMLMPEERKAASTCWRYADAMIEQRGEPTRLKPLPPFLDPNQVGELPPIPPPPASTESAHVGEAVDKLLGRFNPPK